MHTIGLVLHPERDSAEAVTAVLDWAARKGAQVLGMEGEIRRLNCAAIPVTAEELGKRSDLVVSLGGVDVPELPGALSAIDDNEFTVEPRLALDAIIGDEVVTAFNDVATVRFP